MQNTNVRGEERPKEKCRLRSARIVSEMLSGSVSSHSRPDLGVIPHYT